MTIWIRSANSRMYNIQESYKNNSCIDWAQNNNKYETGDYVYIYVTPIQKIGYITKVVKTNIPFESKINDNKYYLNKYTPKKGKYIRLKLIYSFLKDESNNLNVNILKEYGISQLMSVSKVTHNIKLNKHISLLLKRNLTNDQEVQEFLKYLKEQESQNMSNNVQSLNSRNFNIQNTIFYGAPGTGKSYHVTQIIKKYYVDYNEYRGNKNVFRITLYPDYSYADFIGQILPDIENGKPTYFYKKGIFVKALDAALSAPTDPIFLILEEMSRTNIAAVFGDIFQLLDRNSKGNSEYLIDNDQILNHLSFQNQEMLKKYHNGKIFIPSNLLIIGTVNTNDQNVYPMDTAFKRRFEWNYISIDNVKSEDNNPKIKLVLQKNKNIYISWKTFYTNLNKFIVNILGLSEDKQIGPYFLRFSEKDNESKTKNLIQNKLLQYLWSDIENATLSLAGSPKSLFDNQINSFSDLYKKFQNDDRVFSEKFLENFKGIKDEDSTNK